MVSTNFKRLAQTGKVVRKLKQTLKKLNWLSIAQLAIVSVVSIMPLFSVAFIPQEGSAAAIDSLVNSCPADTGVRCTEGNLAAIFRLVINWALAIAFIAAVIVLIFGGFLYITSAGNDDQAKKGRTAIQNALIGVVIIVLSYVIVQIVYRFVSGQGSGAFGS